LAATSPHGPGLSPDSAVYLSTADALEHGRGFQAYGGVPLTDFPPGYPLALAAWLETAGGRPVDAARAVNAASIFALVTLVGLVLRAYVSRTSLRAAGVILVAAAPSLLHVSVTAWSEVLFAASVMACLFFLQRALARGRMVDVALAGACASACMAARQVGVAAVIVGLLALAIGSPSATPRRELIKRCLIFLGVASLAPAVWLISRVSITDSPVGVREPPRANLLENGRDAVSWMAHWFVPDMLPGPVRAVGFAFAVALLCVGAAMWARSGPSRSRQGVAGLWLPALLAGSVIAVTVVGASLTETDPLDFRLLAPALAPSVVVVMVATDRFLDRCPGRAAAGLAAVFLVGWAVAIAAADASVWRGARKGDGYSSARWRESELARLLGRTPPAGRLYSDAPDAVWLLSRRDARCPSRAIERGPCSGLTVPPDKRHPVRAPAQLAWFRVNIGEEATPIPVGRAGCRLSAVATRRDGILFRITERACGSA
jgi:hypothetical protein